MSALDFTAGLEGYLRDGHVLWAYGVLAATTAPPLVPNSALLVTGGVLAAQGRLDIGLVLLVVAGSALLGDLVIHRTGRAVSGSVLTRLYRKPRRRALLEWASVRIERHGVPFVIGVRFLPSGRVIGGLAAGIVRYPARRYAIGAGVAEGVWATYSVGLGYFGGLAMSNSLYAVGLGLGVSLFVAGVGGLAQVVSGRRAAAESTVAGGRVVASGGTAPPAPRVGDGERLGADGGRDGGGTGPGAGRRGAVNS
ncbi:DedA family protein [Streptomyces sp. NPDC088354]|uniref:DedA family protein n=1 Tax=unclassified Streptomyces TaxID=2593676 RepID=UPI0029A4E875|nr:VTT domain-containing protein [Streptomyces sp. MI02-7b]MDX3074667.1 VTT domain-containing protein [Streptomyces sp. MI02-7b]